MGIKYEDDSHVEAHGAPSGVRVFDNRVSNAFDASSTLGKLSSKSVADMVEPQGLVGNVIAVSNHISVGTLESRTVNEDNVHLGVVVVEERRLAARGVRLGLFQFVLPLALSISASCLQP